MEPLVSVLFIRAFERLFILVTGLFLVYLGYKLFSDGVSGKSSLKARRGDGGIELLNAAPGLFFCFFGFILLGLMSFKEVRLNLPSVDNTTTAVDIILSEATDNTDNLDRSGAIPDARQGETSEIILEDALGQLFFASRTGAAKMNFSERLRLQNSYETIYLAIGIDDERINPNRFLEDIRQDE